MENEKELSEDCCCDCSGDCTFGCEDTGPLDEYIVRMKELSLICLSNVCLAKQIFGASLTTSKQAELCSSIIDDGLAMLDKVGKELDRVFFSDEER